jgi:hypothetical protein
MVCFTSMVRSICCGAQKLCGLGWAAIATVFSSCQLARLGKLMTLLVLAVSLWLTVGPSTALANLNDDRYDGNIFPLYAGNGYLVPPKVTLAQSIKSKNPTVLVLYTDDSRDCKNFAPVVSQLDAYYGRAADIIPISIDSIPFKDSYAPTEPGYYYKGLVPQTVLLDQSGKVVLSETGIVPFERFDDKLREIFDLLPRSESVELKRRAVNEINTELVPN